MKKKEVNNYFKEQLRTYKNTDTLYSDKANSWLFSAYCIEHLFFSSDHPANPEIISQCITDGANDKGFDAICTDWNDDEHPIVIIQSKYLESTSLDPTKMLGETNEVRDRMSEYLKGDSNNIPPRISNQLNECRKNCQDPNVPSYKIVYLSTDIPTASKKQNIELTLSSDDLEIYYGDIIIGKIDASLTSDRYVKNDFLIIDNPKNVLTFDNGNAAIFNISAKSLKNLYFRHANGLFGMNLRLFDGKKKKNKVDDGIRQTMERFPNWFWYLNNGLVIACRNFHVEEMDSKLVLEEFSIINGCQTTNGINNNQINEDFYLTCKVVKASSKQTSEEDCNRITVQAIAEATNYQKPIKDVNTKANEPEQIRIQDELRKVGIQYILKVGEPRNSSMRKSISMENLGKYYMAEILQNPAARSNASGLFSGKTYESVYKNMNIALIPDLIELNDKYKAFQRKTTVQQLSNSSVIMKARTYVIAMLCYCSAHFQLNTTANIDVKGKDQLKNELERISKDIIGLEQIFKNKPTEQQYDDLFFDLSQYVVNIAYQLLQLSDPNIDPNRFLQTNESYMMMLMRLHQVLLDSNDIYERLNKLLKHLFKE